MGVGTSFILVNGALVYQPSPDEIRILFLDGSRDEEVWIDPHRLTRADPANSQTSSRVHSVKPLHYCSEVVTFLCKTESGDQLIVWDVAEKTTLGTRLLGPYRSIFVRNDENYLCYGFRKLSRRRRWVWELRILDLRRRSQRPSKHQLSSEFLGSELGQDACFEIIEGYLYGVSSTPKLPDEPNSNDWNSFYYIFRVRLSEALWTEALLGEASNVEILDKRLSWRRQWHEGPLDTRYSDLKLVQNEVNGRIFIYETRREWTPEGRAQRNSYRKEILFPTQEVSNVCMDGEPIPDTWDSRLHVDIREPEDVHAGNGLLKLGESDIAGLVAHSYNIGSRTFLDIVNDPSVTEPDKDRLRLRARPMVQYASDHNSTWPFKGQLPQADPQSLYWPPEPTTESDANLDLLYKLMNPGPIEKVQWAADERFFVFSPLLRGATQPGALILLSFDPALRLHGTRKVDGSPDHPVPRDLLEREFQPDLASLEETSAVQPFHLLIKAPDGQRYGFDFSHG